MADELNRERVFEIVRKGDLNVFESSLDGEPFLIFGGSEDYVNFNARLNGCNFPVSKIDISVQTTISVEIQKCKDVLASDPENQVQKKRLKDLNTWLLYEQHLATNDAEEVCLDDFNIEYGFSDEYSTCIECNCAIRIHPDSCEWTAPLFVEGEGVVCDECADSGRWDDHVLDEYKNCAKTVPECIDLGRLNLVQVEGRSFQNGVHEGMTDDPNDVIQLLNENDIDCWFVASPSQFYVEFNVWVVEENLQKAQTLLSKID